MTAKRKAYLAALTEALLKWNHARKLRARQMTMTYIPRSERDWLRIEKRQKDG